MAPGADGFRLSTRDQERACIIRAVLAAVFNRDVFGGATDYNLSEVETIGVLAAKMLTDMGFKQDHTYAMLRLVKGAVEEWCQDYRWWAASKS